ncbi:phage major capsid protein [Loigolactobacillus bifermentans]|uniref:Phage-related major head protein n=1 Tax=Loigolactobacillus bifermentans DSM 20003 TaxID=1423726 RepID=A0A0R1HB07_9LACO|nr:phage major capsid protein [Loigolactobacillus bifermentans]KRK40898.1 phage-related major head protein [Loigolactobacillus bifermentans DSM 20003]QGG59650.1 phage major capsid protein [Loigolactobacillus bifermentans]
MTLDEKLAAVKKQIKEKRALLATTATEVRTLAEKAESEDDFKAAKEKRDAYTAAQKELKDLEEKRDLYAEALKGIEVPAKPNTQAGTDYRQALNNYIHSRGANVEGLKRVKTDVGTFIMMREGEPVDASDAVNAGVTSTIAKSTIPDAVTYVPQRVLQTVVDLKQFANIVPVTTQKGSYPTIANATTKMASVAELEKNPAMAKPDFKGVDWAVETYRQALPLSQESIDDSATDLVGLVQENAAQIKVNTTNDGVAGILKQFTAVEVSTLDDVKLINNKKLDQAYVRTLIASASFYQWLDTLKDDNGRYLLQDSILSPSGKTLFGMPVSIVDDTQFGADGEAHAFLGDVKRAVLFANRADFMIRWVDDQIYGQYLQAGMRFGVSKADEKAGYFLTLGDTTTTEAPKK